jgi:tRNA G18 (ribose-2'-O)-methylase SpoU
VRLVATSFNLPSLLVLGSEGAGISPGITKVIDEKVRISDRRREPSEVDSLNVSVSAGILLYEFQRRNDAAV